MARGVGSDDNVMGGKEAVINVGFKDDLGNILENASKLKEILDSVNSNFIAINSAVGITTNSMGKLASQTQRLVATTQQLRNEYQSIADASQRIGLSQSVAAPSSIFQNTDVVREALGGGGRGIILGGQQEDAEGSTAGLTRPQVNMSPGLGGILPRRSNIFNQLPSDTRNERILDYYAEKGELPKSLKLTKKQREQIKARGLTPETLNAETIAEMFDPNVYDKGSILKEATYDWRSGGSGIRIASKVLKSFGAGKDRFGSGAIKGIAGMLQKNTFATSLLGEEAVAAAAGGEMGLVSAMGSALAPMAAIALAGIAAYKAADYLIKGSTRYSGLTGGTGVFSNTGAAAGSETFVGMQARAWMEGLTNMAVGPGGFQQIQEALLGAGYTARDNAQYGKMGIRGLRYENTRAALTKLYGVGLQDVDQNLQLMQLVVERGNGSLTSLMSTIDNLRETALKTNASLKVMTATMTASIQGLIGGMNVAGSVATFIGGNNAAAYANSQNTLLRGSGAPDYNNFITQAMLLQTPQMQEAGVNFQNMFYRMAHPELFPQGEGLTFAQATDASIDRIIGATFRVPQGVDLQTAKDIIGQNSAAVMAAMKNPMYQALIGDPKIYNSADATIEWLATNAIGNPQTETAEATIRSNIGRKIDIDRWDRGPGSYFAKRAPNSQDSKEGLTRDEALMNYLANTLHVGGVRFMDTGETAGAFLTSYGLGTQERRDHPLTAAYTDYVMATGNKIGWAEKLINQGGTAASNTYIKFGDQIMSMKQALEFAQTEKGADLNAALMGEGSTKVMMATKEKGQKQSEITGWSDVEEFGGGKLAGDRKMSDMTQNDFKIAVAQGITKSFRDNNASGQHLRVDTDNWG